MTFCAVHTCGRQNVTCCSSPNIVGVRTFFVRWTFRPNVGLGDRRGLHGLRAGFHTRGAPTVRHLNPFRPFPCPPDEGQVMPSTTCSAATAYKHIMREIRRCIHALLTPPLQKMYPLETVSTTSALAAVARQALRRTPFQASYVAWMHEILKLIVRSC